MTDIAPFKGGGEVEQFDPERYRLEQAALDYTIEEAKRIKDWLKLEEAVDFKIEEQHRFFAWWNGKLTDKGGRPSKTVPRPRDGLSMERAEELTGMANQRVSDLGKKLANPDSYRDRLLGAAYQAAMLEAVEGVRGTLGCRMNEWYTPAQYISLARAVL